jgi:hypothetical protein
MLIVKYVENKIKYVIILKLIFLPRSNSPAQKRPVPGISGDFGGAEFRPEFFLIFSNEFQCFPAGSSGIRWPESSIWAVGDDSFQGSKDS